MKNEYKTSRKYKCPYCDFKSTRQTLISHVDSKHRSLFPEGYTAARVVYDSINGKDHGKCMICGQPVYAWNDKIDRYYNLCYKPECRAQVRKIALERHMKVYNKPTLLNDPEQQEKMLANRRISGTYTFSDGCKVTYTGKYERAALEFMDKVLEIPSKDIQAPGPVLEYEYGGKTHKWITDIYYIPGNLLIEIKDGGSNPNKRSMESYRAKQIAKEEMITNMGTFNYIRLTNNDFAQLLAIFADMKNEALTSDSPKVKVHINEEVGGLPPQRPPEAYIIPYGMNNVFDGVAYGDSETSGILMVDNGTDIRPMAEKIFKEKYDIGPRLYYTGNDIGNKIRSIHESMKDGNTISGSLYFAEMLIGRKLRCFEEILLSEFFRMYDENQEKEICKLIENGVLHEAKNAGIGQFGYESDIVKKIDNVLICQSPRGYYARTPDDFCMASEYFSDIEALISSEVVDLMNNIYRKKFSKEDEG